MVWAARAAGKAVVVIRSTAELDALCSRLDGGKSKRGATLAR